MGPAHGTGEGSAREPRVVTPSSASTCAREFFDAIVNATPVGMHPHIDVSPLAANELNCRLVFDTIYRPRRTETPATCGGSRHRNRFRGRHVRRAGYGSMGDLDGQRAPEKAMRQAVVRALEHEEDAGPGARPSGKQKQSDDPTGLQRVHAALPGRAISSRCTRLTRPTC